MACEEAFRFQLMESPRALWVSQGHTPRALGLKLWARHALGIRSTHLGIVRQLETLTNSKKLCYKTWVIKEIKKSSNMSFPNVNQHESIHPILN